MIFLNLKMCFKVFLFSPIGKVENIRQIFDYTRIYWKREYFRINFVQLCSKYILRLIVCFVFYTLVIHFPRKKIKLRPHMLYIYTHIHKFISKRWSVVAVSGIKGHLPESNDVEIIYVMLIYICMNVEVNSRYTNRIVQSSNDNILGGEPIIMYLYIFRLLLNYTRKLCCGM